MLAINERPHGRPLTRGRRRCDAMRCRYRWGEEDGKPNTWHFQEQYSSEAALKAHQMSSHFAGWEAFAATDPFSAPPVLSKFTLRK